jgi:hypothetical protein
LLKVALKHQKINKNLCHKVTYNPITNTVWVHSHLYRLHKRVHSTRSRKWYSLPVACPW